MSSSRQTALYSAASFVITTKSDEWICTNVEWLFVVKHKQTGFITKSIFCTIRCLTKQVVSVLSRQVNCLLSNSVDPKLGEKLKLNKPFSQFTFVRCN